MCDSTLIYASILISDKCSQKDLACECGLASQFPKFILYFLREGEEIGSSTNLVQNSMVIFAKLSFLKRPFHFILTVAFL